MPVAYRDRYCCIYPNSNPAYQSYGRDAKFCRMSNAEQSTVQDTTVKIKSTTTTITVPTDTKTVLTTTTISSSTTSTAASSSSGGICAAPTSLPAYDDFNLLIPQPGSTDTSVYSLGYQEVYLTSYGACCEQCYFATGASCIAFLWDEANAVCLVYQSYSTGVANPTPVPDAICSYGSFYAVLSGSSSDSNIRPGPCIIEASPPTSAIATPTPSSTYLGPHAICGNANLSPGYETFTWQVTQPNDNAVVRSSYGDHTQYVKDYSDCCEACYNNNYQSCLAFEYDPLYSTCTFYSAAGRGIANPNPYPGSGCYFASFEAALTGSGDIHPGPCLVDTAPTSAISTPTSSTSSTSSTSAPTSTPTNIIINGDFESATTDPWSFVASYGPQYVHGFTQSNTTVHGGSDSAYLYAIDVAQYKSVSYDITQNIAAVVNQTYNCDAWYNVQATDSAYWIIQAWYSGKMLSATNGYTADEWVSSNFTLVGSPNLPLFEIRISSSANSPNTTFSIYVDDVTCFAAS
jgi:hypothetical protein